MWYIIFPFLTFCFISGCMISKMDHDKSVQKFDEIEEPEVLPPEEIDFILSFNG